MVIRMKGMPFRANDLRNHLNRLIVDITGTDGFYDDNDIHYTAFSLKRQMHVLPNDDLFIDDDLDPEISGMILQGLRAQHLFQESVVVPRKRNPYANAPSPHWWFTETKDVEEDNVLNFEDFLPETAFDDGLFEEEMERLARGDWDDEE